MTGSAQGASAGGPHIRVTTKSKPTSSVRISRAIGSPAAPILTTREAADPKHRGLRIDGLTGIPRCGEECELTPRQLSTASYSIVCADGTR
jgi:hypothetical protein